MKLTEIRLYPENKDGNKVQLSSIEGEENLLNEMFFCLKRSRDKNKYSYIFEVVRGMDYENPQCYFSLTKAELETAKKMLPDFKFNQTT